MSNGNGLPIDEHLITLGYNPDNMVVMVVNGIMQDGKAFKSVAQLTEAQALKLSDDLRLTVIVMKANPNIVTPPG